LLVIPAFTFLLSSCSSSVRFASGASGNTSGEARPWFSFGTSSPSAKPTKPAKSSTAGELKSTDLNFSGVASYYGDEFHGRKTANGERYDRAEFSAAHRSLPFGTLLKVRNTTNDRSVIVRVNDRGPWKETRVLDVSYAAAKELDLVKSGTAQIEATVLESQ
jgi:rare lipoprotein A